ncbi:MAG: hypothetical protein ROZ37_09690 [Aromatoleum sp.]|uniref:hypothetical protein n=1 Tax=Aromatoleum sp. TaxID=2307007 RepID=UPI00289405C4|nr:hypothetical protein [Aromatoleum sp.]MDT3670591.1 hypothetical protein [Aromatoleum sp.]
MNGSADINFTQQHFKAQMDVTRSCCDLGLKCCKGLADFNAEATSRMIATAEAGRELFLDNGFPKFLAESSRVGLSLWTSLWSGGIEFQKNFLAALNAK